MGPRLERAAKPAPGGQLGGVVSTRTRLELPLEICTRDPSIR